MKSAFILSFLFFFSFLSTAQVLQLESKSSILIKGTSTMHDWESNAEGFEGMIEIASKAGKLTAIKSLSFSVNVERIKSGKKRMDKLTYEAFDSETNPEIKFQFISLKQVENNLAVVIGDLTMAGQTQRVEVSGNYQINGEAIEIIASQPINMEQFGMDPPTAMLGAIKVGPEVTIDFKLIFK